MHFKPTQSASMPFHWRSYNSWLSSALSFGSRFYEITFRMSWEEKQWRLISLMRLSVDAETRETED